jgi:hypothetical protein
MNHPRVPQPVRAASLLLLAACQAALPVLLTGCAHKNPPVASKPIQRAEQPSAARATQQQVDDLEARVNDLAGTSKELPGRTEREHRQLMARAFGDLQRVLVLLNRQGADHGAFQQELSILQSAQRQLETGSTKNLSEPAINTGLRAAAHALTTLAASLDLPDRDSLIKSLNTNLDALDANHGAMHRLAATQTVAAQSDLAARLAKIVANRMGLALRLRQAAASQPAPQPATVPVKKAPHPAPDTAPQPLAPTPHTPATLPATQLLPTTVPAEPSAPPTQPAPRAATKTVTPPPAPGPARELNKE